MADISMCLDKNCPMNKKCWRYKAPVYIKYQSYGDFKWNKNDSNKDGCDYFWDIKKGD